MKKLFVLVLAISMVFSFVACGQTPSDESGHPDTFVAAISGEVLTLDPQIAAGTPAEIARMQMFEPLVIQNDDGTFSPCLATDWKVSDDGAVYTFYLREGVKFHDGSDFNADDVVATFQRLLDRKYGAARVTDIPNTIGVEKVDEYTVNIINDGPVGNFLNQIAYGTGFIMSADAIEEYKEDLGTNPIGTGPYKLVDFQSSEYVEVERFDDYWGEASPIDKVKIVCVTEAATRTNMILTGEAQYAQDISPQDVTSIEESGIANIRYDESNRVFQVGFNLNVEPLNNVLVRQAMNYAIDKDAIIEGVLGGAGSITKNVVATNVFGYVDGPYTYDLDKAKALMKEAGYEDGFEMTIWTPQGRYYKDKDVVLAVAEQLKAININLKVEVHDWSTYLQEVKMAPEETKCSMYIFGWECYTREAGYSINTLFTKKQWAPAGWNVMYYENDKLEEVNEKIMHCTDQAEREEYMHEALGIIMEDAPWIPIFSYDQISAVANGLEGIDVLPTQLSVFKNAYWAE